MTSLPYLSQNLQTKGLNWKAVIFWGIIFGIVGFAVYHFYREPVLAFINSIPTRIGNFQVPDFNNFYNGIIKYVNDNPIAVIATGASLCTAGITIISKIHANREAALALEQKMQAEQYASQTVSLAQQEALDYKQKYEQAIQNTGLNSLQEALGESQNLVSSKEMQIKNLMGQVQALQDALLLKETKMVEKTVVK